jgi:hypothetical protein
MNECRRHRESMESYLAGEIAPADLEDLQMHCTRCSECRQLAALHGLLTCVGEYLPEPTDAELRTMRDGVLRDIDRHKAHRAGSRFWRELGGVLRGHPVAVPAALAVLLAVGVLAGRWSATPADIGSDAALVRAIQAQAEQHEGLTGIWDAPYAFTNVTARPAEDGTVALSFDVCRHVNIAANRESPLTREVLLHAILDPSELGTRLQAMALAPELSDPTLREALVVTMHSDPSPVVRQKAMTELSRLPFDAGIRDALLETLRHDPAVQIRLLALESLAGQRVEFETLRRTIRDAGLASDPAVLQHAARLDEEL